MADVIIDDNHHNGRDVDDNKITSTSTTFTSKTKSNINNSIDITNANSNNSSELRKQSSNDDLFYDKHYNEESFIQFDDNEESININSPISSVSDPDKLTAAYYIKQAQDTLNKLKSLTDQQGWKKLLSHRNGVVVYGKAGVAKDDKLPVFMGEHTIKGFAPQSIFAVIGMRKLWDDWYEGGNLVENLNETTSLTYMVIQALAGSKPRDLSLVEKIECTPEGKIYFVSTSVNTPKMPHSSNRIRAHIHLNGWILEPLSYNPPVTKIRYVLQTNVKGWIPSVLAKKYLSRRPLVIHTIETYLQKNDPPTMFIKTADTFNSTTNNPSISSSQTSRTASFLTNNNISPTHKDFNQEFKQSGAQHSNTENNIIATSITSSIPSAPITNSTRKIKFSDQVEVQSKSTALSETSPKIIETSPITDINSTIDTVKSSLPSSSTPMKPILSLPNTEKSISNIEYLTPIGTTLTPQPTPIQTPPTTSIASTPISPQTTIVTSLEKINTKIPEKNRTAHRHSDALNVAIDNFESQVRSLDGWNFYSDNKGIKIYTKDVNGKSTPIMRGESRISGGFTVEDILSVISSLEMRKLWDERFEDGVELEKLNHSDILVKSMMKGTFPISGRDLSLVSTSKYDFDNGKVKFITTSVVDPLIPETRKYVRAQLNYAGFELIPEFDDNGFTKYVDVKYIVDIDIKLENVPSSILRQVSIQTPMVLNKIDEFLQKVGFTSYIRESTSQTSMKSRVINTKTFECDIEVVNVFGGAVTELKVSRKMYPNGYELTIQPADVKVELLPNKVEVVRIVFPSRNNDDDNTNVMKIKIKRNESKGVKVTYNGGKLIPLASPIKNTTEEPTTLSSSISTTLLSPDSNGQVQDQNQNSVAMSESTNQSITSSFLKASSIHTSISPNFETPKSFSITSITTPSTPLSTPVTPIPVVNSNSNSNEDNNNSTNNIASNVTIPNHHQEISTSTLIEPSEIQLKNNNEEDKKKTLIEEQIFRHLTKTTTTINGGENLRTISINNLNGYFASASESLRFNTQQVGLMFASMLLAYYAGKLSG